MTVEDGVDLQTWLELLLASHRNGEPLPRMTYRARSAIVHAFHRVGAHDIAALARQYIPVDWSGGVRMSAREFAELRTKKRH